jgi:hypothetical protein
VPDPDGTPEQPGEAEDVSSEPASITGIPFMMTKDMRFLARRPTSGGGTQRCGRSMAALFA